MKHTVSNHNKSMIDRAVHSDVGAQAHQLSVSLHSLSDIGASGDVMPAAGPYSIEHRRLRRHVLDHVQSLRAHNYTALTLINCNDA